MDRLSAEQRSANMSKIRGKNTCPEMAVRRMVHGMGYRFRLHRRDLPGRPDIVFGSRRKVIEVRGCFWHRHPDPSCGNTLMPATRRTYWEAKFARNQERDRCNLALLSATGWQMLVIWECEIADRVRTAWRIREFLGKPASEKNPRVGKK
jgi:DNA mismatch endonuclease (patch repair protein)